MFSAEASPPSTPDTSNLDAEDDLVVHAQKKARKVTTFTLKKKRPLEVEDELELEEGAAVGRAAKRRVVQQAAYVEIAVGKVTKVNAIALNA